MRRRTIPISRRPLFSGASFHGDGCRRQLRGFEHGGHGWDHGSRGSSDDLVAGATIGDAFLILKDGRAFFAEVELDRRPQRRRPNPVRPGPRLLRGQPVGADAGVDL